MRKNNQPSPKDRPAPARWRKYSTSIEWHKYLTSAKWRRRLKIFLAFLIVTCGTIILTYNPINSDVDSWYILSEGREIVSNGIYYTDPLSMHDGLAVTVQNYGFSVIFYLIHSVFGRAGVYICSLFLNLLLCYLIYKICMLLGKQNLNLSLFIMILTDFLLCYMNFVSTRAQMASYVILMTLIYLLELYIKTDKTKYLYFVPLLSLVSINLHASQWPFILVILAVYIIDSFKNSKLHLQGYRTKPLVITFMAALLVGFINPYGPSMMTLMFTSYTVPAVQANVPELQAFRSLGSVPNILLSLVIISTMFIYIFHSKKQNLHVRWLLLTFGFLILGLNTVKMMSHVILVLLFPLSAIFKNAAIENYNLRKFCKFTAVFSGIVCAISAIVVLATITIPILIADQPYPWLTATIARLDEDTAGTDKKSFKIYTAMTLADGGYAEWHGYRPYIDERVEVFLGRNNGGQDIYLEYLNLQDGKIKPRDFLAQYQFDYLVVADYDILYSLESPDYDLIFETKNPNIGQEQESTWINIRLYKRNV